MSTNMLLSPAQISEFVQRVVGTTLNMDTVLEEEFGVPGGMMGLDEATLTDIESEVFECEVCNWNVARDGESDSLPDVCDECHCADEEAEE